MKFGLMTLLSAGTLSIIVASVTACSDKDSSSVVSSVPAAKKPDAVAECPKGVKHYKDNNYVFELDPDQTIRNLSFKKTSPDNLDQKSKDEYKQFHSNQSLHPTFYSLTDASALTFLNKVEHKAFSIVPINISFDQRTTMALIQFVSYSVKTDVGSWDTDSLEGIPQGSSVQLHFEGTRCDDENGRVMLLVAQNGDISITFEPHKWDGAAPNFAIEKISNESPYFFADGSRPFPEMAN